MAETNIFLSVGGVFTERQDEFVRALEEQLRAEGLTPNTVGRNTFSVDAPLKTITKLMDDCSGTVVVALERTYFQSGLERRGSPKQAPLNDIKLATPWNQIEAALAYSRKHPLLVIVEEGVMTEGLLEPGYDWYVQKLPLDVASLRTPAFLGILRSWKQKLTEPPAKTKKAFDPGQLSIGDILQNLKPGQLWAVGAAMLALLVGAFTLGTLASKINLSASSKETTAMVCTGKLEEKCAGSHDLFLGCTSATREAIGAAVCADLHRKTATVT